MKQFEQLRNHGDEDLIQYLIARINVAPNGCWLWTGAQDGKGYGRVSYHYKYRRDAGERLYGSWIPRAHIVTYCMVNGSRPTLLDHFVCDNKRCCNPWHVRPETFVRNVLRGTGPTAINKRKTHCPQGHEYTPENTKLVGPNKTGRRCKICFYANRNRRRRYLVKIGLHPHSRKKTITQQLRELSTSPPHNSADRV